MKAQLSLPGFDTTETFVCPLCGREGTFFAQFSPFLPWFVCRECCIANPYPDQIIVFSTRRNADKNPYMIDPAAPHETRELRMRLDEMLRCAVDPSRLDRPVVKYNLSGLEIYNPIRRSRSATFHQWHRTWMEDRTRNQMALPYCTRCGCAHDRKYEMLDGLYDYHTHCQRCDDELQVESLFSLRRGVFGEVDAETILDKLYQTFPDLFTRGVLPDYWFRLTLQGHPHP